MWIGGIEEWACGLLSKEEKIPPRSYLPSHLWEGETSTFALDG